MSIKLSFNAGSLSGTVKELKKEKITFGRGSDNDVRFDARQDLDASKNHAEITLENGEYWITDLNSTNGTYVNGKKVERMKLSSGDSIEFGKGGPKTSVDVLLAGAGDTAPKTRVAKAVDAGGSGVGSQTVAMMIQDALDKAKSSDRGAIGGTAVFIKESVNNAIKKSSRTFKAVTSVVIIALIGAIVFLAVKGQDVKKEYDQKLDQASQQVQQSQQQVQNLQSQMATEKDKFSTIINEYHDSVCFIYSETSIYDARGNTANVVQGFGTGFFVRDDGYIITNKHIVEPWKFDPDQAYIVALAKANNLKVETFTCVWINGVRFRAAGKFSFEQSYNTRDGNLELFTTAEDRMTQAFRKPNWRPGIEVEVHKKDNNDIAILKAIGGPFKSVKIYRGTKPYKTTDPVVVYGFPLGVSPQELANTNASAAFGRIRKIENTIQLDVPVLPGNSGGPVFTDEGYVIGVMTRRFAESLNEAITIDHAIRLVPGL